MKFIFMLLILFILTDPVMAKPVSNTSECLNMYHTYMNQYGASKFIPDAQMRDFIGRCLPDNAINNTANQPTYIDGTQRQKLLHNIDNKKVVPVKT